MKTAPRYRMLLAVAALALLPVYQLPLWSVRLVAPQYPDGLGLYIGVSQITEHSPHDLQNINILNHYIGMQAIEPDAIPELEVMPVVLGALIVAGLLAALVGRRWIMAAWLAAFIALGIAGMVDFYQWKYDYGHNLSPDAPIKVPGMTYQPPLIGTKQLLNITASSYPYWGTFFVALATALGAVAVVGSFRRRSGARGTMVNQAGETKSRADGAAADGGHMRLVRTGAALALAWVVAACAADDRGQRDGAAREAHDAIVYGQDEDAFCGESVDRVRWGGEIRVDDGARFRFRSVECLAAFVLAGRVPPDRTATVKVVDFAHGWRLIDAATAIYLHTPNLASPNRLNLLAVQSERLALNLQEAYSGRLLEWDAVLAMVSGAWQVGSP